jgi:hypothetical protein
MAVMKNIKIDTKSFASKWSLTLQMRRQLAAVKNGINQAAVSIKDVNMKNPPK